jgi:hypothetical protein
VSLNIQTKAYWKKIIILFFKTNQIMKFSKYQINLYEELLEGSFVDARYNTIKLLCDSATYCRKMQLFQIKFAKARMKFYNKIKVIKMCGKWRERLIYEYNIQ